MTNLVHTSGSLPGAKKARHHAGDAFPVGGFPRELTATGPESFGHRKGVLPDLWDVNRNAVTRAITDALTSKVNGRPTRPLDYRQEVAYSLVGKRGERAE